jgi:sec-independent protein translocase protein TatB
MEILGIGPLELLFILLIALIVLGPRDMAKAGKSLGRFLRKIVTSPEWRTVQKASRELRYLPNRLMREAAMEDISKDLSDINKIGGQISQEVKSVESDLSSWTTPPESDHSNLGEPESPSPTTTNPSNTSNPITPANLDKTKSKS